MFSLERRQQLVILIVIAVLVFGGGYRYALWQNKAAAGTGPGLEQFPPADAAPASMKEIVVYVVGAVEKPGLYRLPPGSRWGDAIGRAVARPDAALEALNLAAPLPDGQKVVVPTRQQVAGSTLNSAPASPAVPAPGAVTAGTGPFTPIPGGGQMGTTAGTAKASGSPVNINTAGPAELDSLPGIGPSLAQRIILYRETSGAFKTPEDIKNVSGIGDKKYEELKNHITVN